MAPALVSDLLQRQEASGPIVAKTPPFKTSFITVSEQVTTPLETNPPPHPNTQILRDPSYVTTDFDKLRFNAAAYTQLIRRPGQQPAAVPSTDPKTSQEQNASQTTSNFLISSPYNTAGHYLDISSPALPTPSRLFALALTALKPTVSTYATAEYTSALNFDDVLRLLRELIHEEGEVAFTWKQASFYVVTFRSKLQEGIDNDHLYKLDSESHREACESGGLLKYWFGKTDEERRNLATCEFLKPCFFLSFSFSVLFFHGLSFSCLDTGIYHVLKL